MILDAGTGVTFDWSFFWGHILEPSSAWLTGLWRTIYISVISQALGVVLGFLITIVRRSRLAPLRAVGSFYVWVVRGTPLLVQLVLVYNGLAATGIYKFSDITVGDVTVLGVVQAAILTLAVHEGAYMSEIIRASLDAVDHGQIEAAAALGMTPSLTMRIIHIPQAVRIVIPPLGNEFNLMMKNTTLLSVIGLQEMFLTAQDINSTTFKTFEIFAVAGCYYLFLTTVWGFVQRGIERKLGDPSMRVPRQSALTRLTGIGSRSTVRVEH
ncbi:amino acid ABC transporter permease [Leekyejoonella antrihumi]|uniref:Amino acid ABC transporter permease n=1 Tax=Leekyejoonella antrihumi TaxID=1660198 RepID=A0A563E3F1_9MICO|nr:amino acid ABC transporter permease [Leekyejoonella antrihumi]TWP37050.1 amino acid ABC transporter permease [Leekyejoonella antrihumi]